MGWGRVVGRGSGQWVSTSTRKVGGVDEGCQGAMFLCFRAAPMQYEGPGVETLLTPSEDGDAHVLLRLRQRFCGLARCLGLMLRCVGTGGQGRPHQDRVEPGDGGQSGWGACAEDRSALLLFSSEFGAPVSVPVQEILDVICRALSISAKSIVSGAGALHGVLWLDGGWGQCGSRPSHSGVPRGCPGQPPFSGWVPLLPVLVLTCAHWGTLAPVLRTHPAVASPGWG